MVTVDSKIGFGSEVYDYLNGSQNKCGVYRLILKIDGVEFYAFTIDEISFGETRYIRSHLDYEEKVLNKRNVHRLFREPNNKLSIYDNILDAGLYSLSDTLVHKAEIIAIDAYGNTSTLSFLFSKGPSSNLTEISREEDVYIKFEEGVDFNNDVFRFVIPSYGIFSDSWFLYSVLPSDSGFFSDIHSVGDEYTPFNKYPSITMKVTKPLNGVAPEKLLIASISPNGELKSEGGGASAFGVSAKVSGFGRYVVTADTVPPQIKKYSFKNRGWYAPNDRISFKISDDLSGIKTYNGYIDGQWALFEFDAKSGTLFYKMDPTHLERKKELHKLEIFVLDDRNNMRKFEGEFYF